MYRPRAFIIDDVSLLHSVMRERAFATIVAVVDGSLQFAYAPLVVDVAPAPFGSARFHLARANPLAARDDIRMRVAFLCADAYVSPDWYRTGSFVPTWNYIAIEGEGVVHRLDGEELRRLVTELSTEHEKRLRPKQPWTVDKLAPDRMDLLLRAIHGFALPFETLEGKFKLSQDKAAADIDGVIAGMAARGDPASLAVARAMEAARSVIPP